MKQSDQKEENSNKHEWQANRLRNANAQTIKLSD